VGPNSHLVLCSLWTKVHRTFFVERGRNRWWTDFFPILDILTLSGDIRARSLKLPEIALNFACFWPPISLGGGPPEFLDLRYKDVPHCDHVAKFRGDRPRELDFVVTEKKISAAKHKASRYVPPGTNVPGGLKKNSFHLLVSSLFTALACLFCRLQKFCKGSRNVSYAGTPFLDTTFK